KKSMVIDYEVIKRYHEIMKKYSLDLKRYHRVNGEKSKGIINSEMEKEIFNSIDMNQDSFNISYQVYRELNKRCKYSSDHVALRAIGNKELAMDIYNKDISNIDKNDNDVTCNSWANMYAYLLVKLGFNARVCGKYHKYVEFDCDGTLMRADATEVNTKSRDGFSLKDITRCHLGLQVENFICLEEDKELDDIIDYAYHDSKDVNAEGIAELKRMEQFYKDEYFGTVAKTQTSEKILMIKKKCLESGLHDAELSKYIDLLMRISFSYQELRDMDVNYIAVKDDTKYSLSVIFNMGESYYIFDDKIGLIVKSKDEVIKDFNDGSLVLVGKNARCKLLDDKEENVYARVG
ncbi:MAG: hypothetical protein K2I70_00405, partial [Bacilli bacterium]|nr:hypothetical protein [Bacilli bacterium]